MYRIVGADQQEYGPVTADQVREWVSEGRANAQTKIKYEGTADWKPLAEFPEFADLFRQESAAPPPPPGGVPPPPGGGPLPPTGGAPPSYPAVGAKTNGLAIAGFVCSILGVIPPCCMFFLFSGLGLIFSILGLKQINANPHQFTGKGLAIAGIVLGGIGLALTLSMWLTTDFNEVREEFMRQLEEQ